MKPQILIFALIPLAFSLSTFHFRGGTVAPAASPTYDPLVEPPIPPNPTELDLGRNLYWHWCMPCHGDRGQGLTDEFRLIWEPDHQDCWGRGCHGGRPKDEGFPIPTVVPALRAAGGLARFAALEDLEVYLASTHPPQRPGSLKPEEYRAIALYVFALNDRSLQASAATPTSTASSPYAGASSLPASILLLAALVPVAALVAFFALRAARASK